MTVENLIDYLKNENYHAEVKIETTCNYCGKRKEICLEEKHLDVVDDFRTLLIEIE